MATASAFSYAQAAKGQGASGSNTPSNPVAPAQDLQQPESTSKSPPPTETIVEPTDTPQEFDIAPSSTVEKQDATSSDGLEPEAPSAVNMQETLRESSHDEEASRLDRPWRRNDKSTRSSSTTTRSVDEQETRRPRKSKRAKGAEKPSSENTPAEKEPEPVPEPPKIELFEAPIPSVNIWQQRKEAQLAKVKPVVNASAVALDGHKNVDENTAAAITVATTTGTATAAPISVNGAKSHRKTNDTSRPERSAPRGSRLSDKDNKEIKAESLPSVADAIAWPTPETSVKDDKKKSIEKVDRPEKDISEDLAHVKSRQKWVAMDYVPTVNFETQIPQIRGNKPRAGVRNTTGTRAATSSGNNEKSATAPPQSKQSDSKERPRETVNGSHRNTSSPPTTKRTPADQSSTREQKKPTNPQPAADKTKEPVPSSNEQNHGNRERPEGRGDRPRGAYRGRGGHHSVNTQHHQHSVSTFPATGALPSRSQGPYSPPARQGAHGQIYMPQQRGGRGGRGNANGSYSRMSVPNGAPRMHSVQTQFEQFNYAMPSMPVVPYQTQPYWDSLMPILRSQIEYYFSIENLCKDMYLRGRMDSQGFVPLPFIANFQRVQNLSSDINLIRAVCEISTEIDFVVGDDDLERLRRNQGWENFVLPMKDRDELGRNHGPARFTFKNRQYPQIMPQYNGMASPYGVTSPAAYPGHGEASYQQHVPHEMVMNGAHGYMNGTVNGNLNGHAITSQLSADVPDFSPSGNSPLIDQFRSSKNASPVVNGLGGEESSSKALSNGVHSA